VPKIKSHKATSKRFALTGSGMLRRTKLGKGHLRRRTPAPHQSAVHRDGSRAGKSIVKRIKRLAPYLKEK